VEIAYAADPAAVSICFARRRRDWRGTTAINAAVLRARRRPAERFPVLMSSSARVGHATADLRAALDGIRWAEVH
jgi:hypothetical protein